MGAPHGILYENEFQNPQIFQQTISLFTEQSTLKVWRSEGFENNTAVHTAAWETMWVLEFWNFLKKK
jgi:hypothetical protein